MTGIRALKWESVGTAGPRSKRLFILVAGAYILLQTVATPASGNSEGADTSSVTNGETRSTPLLYEVYKGKNKLYLMGTFHVGRPGMYPLGQPVLKAFHAAKALALESNDDPEQAARTFASVAFLKPGQVPHEWPPPMGSASQRLVSKFGISETFVGQAKPLTLVLALTVADAASVGLTAEWGTESMLIRLAKAQGKSIVGVEPEGFALDLAYQLPFDDQLVFLDSAAADIDTGRNRAETETLLRLWQAGDPVNLASAWERQIASLPASVQQHERKELAIRSRTMEAAISGYLGSGDRYFVAVGFGHLLGPDGIVALLQRHGYRTITLSPEKVH